MENTIKYYPSFDDLVFEFRNKEYGAYELRKKYGRTGLIAMVIGIIILTTAIVVPYIRAKNMAQHKLRDAQEVIAEMANDLQNEEAAPPPPPPPPPVEEQQTVVKYVAPVVVDSIKPDEQFQLMSTDEQVETAVDKEVVEVQVQVQEEVQEEEAPKEVFTIVEEMPSFPGGDAELLKFIAKNIVYPPIAEENNVQGKVILRFCVTYKGTVEQISVVRGVDPALDAEAIRVIGLLPTWKPGKQGGKPVNVWYTVPISFQLQ